MLGALTWILSTVEAFGVLVEWGVVSSLNLLFAGVSLAVEALFSLLPGMPHLETVQAEWLAYLNWFFPLGALVLFFGTLVTAYIAWLAIRYLMQLLRAA